MTRPGQVAVVLALTLTACRAPTLPGPVPDELSEPNPDQVDAVLFLLGDAGAATVASAPLIHRLRDDVERWSARVPRDSAVVVLFLGDNVYPEGVRAHRDHDFATDSARLFAQVWTVAGAEARRAGARGLFVAGNHDWGNARAPSGLVRLRNEQDQLEAYRTQGLGVALVPAAGEPGPTVVDVGSRTRIVAIDTHWWLQSAEGDRKAAVARGVAAALEGAGARNVVVAAHHPNVSAGPHGGADVGGLDPFWLLRRSGTLVQDLNSAPYRALVSALGDAFERAGAPLVYAAGHDHSLQILRGRTARDPAWTLVSGAASKHTGVGRADALEWASHESGYMRLVIGRDGSAAVFVESIPSEQAQCEGDPAALETCITRGVEAVHTSFVRKLR